MKRTFTQKGGLLAVALLAAASGLTTAGERAPAEAPTLTNHVGQPGDRAEQQLPLGVGLIGVGMLGLAIGLATLLATRPSPRRRPIAT